MNTKKNIQNKSNLNSPLGVGGSSNMFYGAMPILFELAKELRDNQTEAEFFLWENLSRLKKLNVRFKRQHPILYFIADFYCHKAKLVIEVDGGYHDLPEQYLYDKNRDSELVELGLKVIHFTNEQVLYDIERTLNVIERDINERISIQEDLRDDTNLNSPQFILLAGGVGANSEDECNSVPLQGLGVTEQSSLHSNLDKKSIGELLVEMNEEDQKVALAVQKTIPQIEELVEKIVERMKRGGRIFYVGAGTSGRLGVLDASEIPPTFGMPSSLVIGMIAGGEKALRSPVENAEDDTEKAWAELQTYQVNKNDTVIGIAASGTTPYVVGALRNARAKGILTASIACNPDSPIAHEADIQIEVIVGPEFVTGSTRLKSGTAQKLVLNMISTTCMIKLGRVKGNKMVNMQLSNAKLIDRGTRMLVDELGLEYDRAKNLLLIHGSVKKAIEVFSRKI